MELTPKELTVYMVEIHEQCRIAITAYFELEGLIDLIPSTPAKERANLNATIWARLQTIMSVSKLINKMLWPVYKNSKKNNHAILRAERIRQLINLDYGKPLLSDKVRNAFEHMDELLFEWLEGPGKESLWGWSISPFLKEEENEQVKNAFRYFNIFTYELPVAGESCNLKEIINQISDLEARLP